MIAVTMHSKGYEEKAKLLTFYGPKPEEFVGTNKQWVTLNLWREIKNKIKSVAHREASVAVEAAQAAVDTEYGDEVV